MSVSTWSTPDAKRATRIESTKAERAAVISAGLTGLDMAAVTQTHPSQSRLHLWEVKTGRREAVAASERGRREVNIAMAEPMVKLFSERTGLKVRRTGLLTSKEYPWMVAVVDGLSEDGGQVEVTTTISHAADDWGTDSAPSIPAHILTRVAHDLLVTGRSHAHVVCLVMDTRKVMIRRVERAELVEVIAHVLRTGREFWHEYVLTEIAPPLTALDKSAVAARAAGPELAAPRAVLGVDALRTRREQLKDEMAELERQLAALDAQLIAEIGDSSGVVDAATGELVATFVRDGKFDDKAARADHADLVAQYTVSVATLDWRALTKEHPQMLAYKGRTLRVKASAKGRKADADRSLRALFRVVA